MLRELGDVRIRRQEYDKAEASCREAIECYQASGDPDVGFSTWALAVALDGQGRFDDARELKRRLVPWLRERGQHVALASALASVAADSLKRCDYSSAEQQARECLEIRKQVMPDSWLRYNSMSLLGGALAGLGRFEEAEPLLLEGYQEMDVPAGVGMPRKRQALERIVKLYEAWGREDDAAKWRKKLEDGK